MTKEEKAAYNLEYRLKNADKIKKQKAKHYKENKEKFNEILLLLYKEFPKGITHLALS